MDAPPEWAYVAAAFFSLGVAVAMGVFLWIDRP